MIHFTDEGSRYKSKRPNLEETMKTNKFKPITPFKSYKDEANFWDTHSVLRDWNSDEIKKELNREKKEEVIHIKVEPILKAAIEAKAKSEDRTVSNAIRKVIKEWINDS